jgi:hypothetical protein
VWLAILPRWRSDGRENEKKWIYGPSAYRDDLVRTLIVNSDTASSHHGHGSLSYYLEMIHGDPSFGHEQGLSQRACVLEV